MLKRIISIVVVGSLLAGCQTLSTASPQVELNGIRKNTCKPGNYTRQFSEGSADTLYNAQSIGAAGFLIDNYIIAYRCAADDVAEGRAFFDVNTFLLATAAATGVAFGLNETEIIGLGVAAATSRGGSQYFAPKEKASVFTDALIALRCVKREATGSSLLAGYPPADQIRIYEAREKLVTNPQVRYFALVENSLGEINTIVRRRLSNVGNDDFSSILAEINQIGQNKNAAEGKANSFIQEASQKRDKSGNNALSESQAKAIAAVLEANAALELLKPQLSECVLKAKVPEVTAPKAE